MCSLQHLMFFISCTYTYIHMQPDLTNTIKYAYVRIMIWHACMQLCAQIAILYGLGTHTLYPIFMGCTAVKMSQQPYICHIICIHASLHESSYQRLSSKVAVLGRHSHQRLGNKQCVAVYTGVTVQWRGAVTNHVTHVCTGSDRIQEQTCISIVWGPCNFIYRGGGIWSCHNLCVPHMQQNLAWGTGNLLPHS